MNTGLDLQSNFGARNRVPQSIFNGTIPSVKTIISDPNTVTKAYGTGKITESHYYEAIYQWKIPDYLLQNTTAIRSSLFSFVNCKWWITLYPKGVDGRMLISLSKEDTAVADEKSTVEVEQEPKDTIFVVGVVKCDGSLIWKEQLKFNFAKTGSCKKSICWERQKLVNHKSDLLPSGTLTVAFFTQQGIFYSSIERNMGLLSLSSDLKDLFLTKRQSDVIIKLKDAEFEAHKTILAARSSVLASAFEHDMSEKKTNVIHIEDCDSYSFGEFLAYLYSGEIGDTSFKTIHGLYVTADKYNVQNLKASCRWHIMDNLTVDNVCTIIALANLYEENDMMSSAQDFFACNYSQIVDTAEWELLLKTDYRLANKVLKTVVSKKESSKK